ncbi:MAG TPA: cytochrome c [Acidimicrobiales bacterium]
MTQVPEYLLERSRARRAALGLGGDAPAAASAAPSADGGDAPAATTAAPASAEVAPAAVATAPTQAPPGPAVPLPEYVTDPGPKSGIPVWMMPVLLLIPLWGILYMGSFGDTGGAAAAPTPAQLYTSNCAACHGGTGEGGVGPKLSGGEALATFPDEAEHIKWVEEGSQTKRGQPYGAPDRPGGQRVANTGGMPGFSGTMSPEEIAAVVEYERGL